MSTFISAAVRRLIVDLAGWGRRAGRVLQGADPTGVADSTAAFLALLSVTIPGQTLAVLPAGTYRVTGPITPTGVLPTGGLHIMCMGDVTINVDPAAAPMDALIQCVTTATNNSSITGARLTLNLSGRVTQGLYVRHLGGVGGVINWAPLTVTGAKNNGAASLTEAAGIMIYGRYSGITMRQPTVTDVDRVNAAGACKGISINDISGHCLIDAPVVSRVLCTGASSDADGIAVFGYAPAGVYANREGSLTINDPIITDCQGRAIKTQISDSMTSRPRIFRRAVVAFATADIDHQVGGDHVIDTPFFEYRKNGAVSPIPAGWYPLSWQAQCTDRTNRLQVRGGTVRSEVQMARFAFHTVGAGAGAGQLTLHDPEFQALGDLAAAGVGMFTRACAEVDAAQVAAGAGKTSINIYRVRGNLGDAPLLGYINAPAAAVPKLEFDLVGNQNTGALQPAFGRLSGTVITSASPTFRLADNAGFADYLGSWNFDFRALLTGNRFCYETATSTVSNGPAGAVAGYAFVECIGQPFAGGQAVRLTMNDAATIDTVFVTQKGTAWGKVK